MNRTIHKRKQPMISTKGLLFAVFALSAGLAAAGTSGWTLQNPYPQPHSLHDVSFTDVNTGIAVGDAGTIISTRDGGDSWTIQDAGTTEQLRAIEHLNASTAVVVGSHGVVLRSTDIGANWSPVDSGTVDHLNSLSFVDPLTGFALGDGGTLLKTTDGGLTWSTRSVGVGFSTVYKDLSFVDANIGWVVGFNYEANSDLILRTTDGGATWTDQSTGAGDNLFGIQALDAEHALVIGYGWLLRTTDGGVNWTEVVSPILGTGDGNPDNDIPLEEIEFLDANHGYIVAHNVIVRTSDGGQTWVNQYPAGLQTSFPGGIAFVDLNTVTIVGANGGDILRTTDGGSSWTRQYKSVFGDPFVSLDGVHFTDANTGTVVGSAIARTTDGGTTWVLQESGLSEWEYLSDVFFLDANNGFAVGTDYWNWRGVILKTTDGGTTWTRQSVTKPLQGVHFTDPEHGTVVGEDGFIAITWNGGATWTPRSSRTVNTLTQVAFADANAGIVVGREGTVRYTTNGGTNWNIGTLSPEIWLSDVAFPSPEVAIAVGFEGFRENQLILRSTDGGATWSSWSTGREGGLDAVTFFDALTGTAVGDHATMFRTTDAGLTWTLLDSPEWGFSDVFFVDANIGTVVGGDAIFRTTTGGQGEVNPGTQPRLSVALATGEVVLSWPASSVGFVPQWSDGVGSSEGWSPVAGVPVLVGDHWEYREPASEIPTRFYRLFHP